MSPTKKKDKLEDVLSILDESFEQSYQKEFGMTMLKVKYDLLFDSYMMFQLQIINELQLMHIEIVGLRRKLQELRELQPIDARAHMELQSKIELYGHILGKLLRVSGKIEHALKSINPCLPANFFKDLYAQAEEKKNN